jgi:xylan 1,4-beta-xylosidase
MTRAWVLFLAAALSSAQTVSIRVDAQSKLGSLRPIWSYAGYDEPNYTYMKDGQKLLSQLAAASRVPVYVRTHNLLVTGDGTPSLKWGSTNAYTEDAAGNPRYDWTIVDRIFDTYIERGMKPLVEIGFMPEALSVKPQPYRHSWPGDLFTGWAYPPKDYNKWSELVYHWVRHCVEKYGRAEVETWLWELWNEPDIGYWKGTPEEFFKLYDSTAAAVRRALPTARIGGPDTTGPAGKSGNVFLRAFLDHVLREGSPLDFVAFHAKGNPKAEGGTVVMGSEYQLRDLAKGFEIVASYPRLKGIPVIIGESDPEGCAACSARLHPQYAYRNGVMYSSYTAAIMPRHLDLAARYGVNLVGAVTWAFEFEGQPYFDGFRDLATNGIAKPVLNVFRMLGMLTGDRLAVEDAGALPLDTMLAAGVKDQPDIHAIASGDARSIVVLVSNYHDSAAPGPPAAIRLSVAGLAAGRAFVERYRVDHDYSNAYEAWKKMGSPQPPSAEQYAQLEHASELQLAESPHWVTVREGSAGLEFSLPRHGVTLVRLTW